MEFQPFPANRGTNHQWNSPLFTADNLLRQPIVAWIFAVLSVSSARAVAGGACGSCGGSDRIEITFRASADLAAAGSVAIELNQLTMSADATGAGLLATSAGLAITAPETVVNGQITVTEATQSGGQSGSMSASVVVPDGIDVSADFEPDSGCGQTVEIRVKVHPAEDFGSWSSNLHPTWGSLPISSSVPITIDYQIRALRADPGTAVAPAAVTEMTPPAKAWVNDAWQDDPAAFTSQIPLGLTAETGHFNAGSLVLAGPISPGLASRNNLELRSPFDKLQAIYDPLNEPDKALRQVMSPKRLADIVDIIDGEDIIGLEVRIYEQGDFSQTLNPSGTYDINEDAQPSVTYRYLTEPAGTGNLGGVRMETIHRDGSTEVREYLSITASEYQIITGDNLETISLVSNLTQDPNNGPWHRTDIETIHRDGILFSKTEREFILQSVPVSVSDKSVTAFMTAERRYTDGEGFLETAITPSPYHGLPATVTRPDGSWEVRSYYDGTGSGQGEDPAWYRLPKTIVRPWNNGPEEPPSNNSTTGCQVTTLTYFMSAVDYSFLPASQNTTLPPSSRVLATPPAVGPLITILSNAGLTSAWLPATTDPVAITLADVVGAEQIPTTTIRYSSRPTFGLTNPPPFVSWAGRTFATLDAEGNGSVTGYEAGTYNSANGTFASVSPPNLPSATHLRVITLGLRNFGLPASNEATKRVVVEDLTGRVLREELYLRDDNAWSSAAATVTTTTYDDAPANALATMTRSHDGRVTSEVIQVSPFQTIVIDEQGIRTTTITDALGRTTSVTQEGCGDQPSRTTITAHAGRNSSSTTSAGNLALATSQTSDLLGRTTSQTDPTGAVTATGYPNGGRDSLVTLPGNNTQQTTRTRDGLPISVTGTAVVNEHWTYEIQNDNLITTHRTGAANSSRLTKTGTDPAGREVTVISPSPAVDETTVTLTTTYAPSTRRAVSRSSSAANTTPVLVTQPSPDSSLIRSGFDADQDDALTPASIDRITETHNYYTKIGDLWWSVTHRQIYDTDNSATSVITTSTRERLNGNTDGTADAILQTLSGGGTILTETTLNRTAKTRTTTTSRTGCTLPETTANINGLDVSQTSHQSAVPTRRVFDALGRIFIETSPLGAVTKTIWNHVGQIETVTDHFNHPAGYIWWEPGTAAAGRVKSITNAKGKTTLYTWSSRGELLTTTGTAEYPVRYTYDDYGDLHTLMTWRDATTAGNPATGDTTTWHRDPASGVLLTKTYPDTNATNYTWYPTGKPESRTWQRGAITTWTWSDLGDLTGISYTGDNDLTPDVTITAHSRLGQPLTITQSGIGTEALTYHPGRGAPATHTYASAHTLLPDKGIIWSAPDANDFPTGYTPTDGPLVSYTWQEGLLDTISAGTNQTHTYDYPTNSKLVHHVTAADDEIDTFRQTYSHDIAGRLLGTASNALGSGTHPITRHGYQLDELNRRTQTTQLDGSTWTWGHNDRSEVTSAIRKQPGGTPVTALAASYTFDEIGNRATSASPILGDFTYTPNSANQYGTITAVTNTRTVLGSAPTNSTITVNSAAATRSGNLFYKDISDDNSEDPKWLAAVISDGTESQTRHCWLPAHTTEPDFDADGNLDNDGQWSYSWDAENRLVKMESTIVAGRPYRKLTFAYDWAGRRLARKVEDTNNTTLSDTRWLYDGWNPVAEYDGTTLSKTYLWGLDLSGTLQGAGGVGGLLSISVPSTVSGSPVFHPSFDGNGNITAWTQSGTTAPACLREYDAFGNIVVEQGVSPCSFGFSTKLEDPETGLMYYGLRYYHPPTGRWPSRDPIEEEGGLNLYGFVGNDGISYYDYLGLDTGIGHVETPINPVPYNPEQTQGPSKASGMAGRVLKINTPTCDIDINISKANFVAKLNETDGEPEVVFDMTAEFKISNADSGECQCQRIRIMQMARSLGRVVTKSRGHGYPETVSHIPRVRDRDVSATAEHGYWHIDSVGKGPIGRHPYVSDTQQGREIYRYGPSGALSDPPRLRTGNRGFEAYAVLIEVGPDEVSRPLGWFRWGFDLASDPKMTKGTPNFGDASLLPGTPDTGLGAPPNFGHAVDAWNKVRSNKIGRIVYP